MAKPVQEQDLIKQAQKLIDKGLGLQANSIAEHRVFFTFQAQEAGRNLNLSTAKSKADGAPEGTYSVEPGAVVVIDLSDAKKIIDAQDREAFKAAMISANMFQVADTEALQPGETRGDAARRWLKSKSEKDPALLEKHANFAAPGRNFIQRLYLHTASPEFQQDLQEIADKAAFNRLVTDPQERLKNAKALLLSVDATLNSLPRLSERSVFFSVSGEGISFDGREIGDSIKLNAVLDGGGKVTTIRPLDQDKMTTEIGKNPSASHLITGGQETDFFSGKVVGPARPAVAQQSSVQSKATAN